MQPSRYFREIARVVDVSWDIAVGGDLAFPGVEGRRTVKVRLVNAYLARLHAAAARDEALSRAFIRVAALVDRPEGLLRPGVALRVLRGNLRHPEAGTSMPEEPAVQPETIAARGRARRRGGVSLAGATRLGEGGGETFDVHGHRQA